jgi:hypothetical protein
LGLGLIQPGDFSSYPQIEIAMNFMLNSEWFLLGEMMIPENTDILVCMLISTAREIKMSLK